MDNLQWHGGRLIIGEISLSTSMAWDLIPFFPEIANACENILEPNPYTDPTRNGVLANRYSIVIEKIKVILR